MAVALHSISLYEWLGSHHSTGGSRVVTSEFYRRWSDAVSSRDPLALSRRLSWSNLDVNDVQQWSEPDGSQRRPEWLVCLCEVMKEAAAPHLGDPSAADAVAESFAFYPFYKPFVDVAHRELCTRVPNIAEYVSKPGIASLRRQLIFSLSDICSRVLDLEFCAFRAEWYGEGVDVPSTERLEEMAKSDVAYKAFVQEICSDGFSSLFREYASMARLAATHVLDWVSMYEDLLTRLVADSSAIETQLGVKGVLPVRDIITGLSDRHACGLTVSVLILECQTRLVYKPKALEADVIFGGLLDWLASSDENEPCLNLRYPKVIDRHLYGWSQWIEALECRSEAEATLYFERCGVLLFLLHILNGIDAHRENIIANGDCPVLIDLETIMQPFPARPDQLGLPAGNAQVLLDKLLEQSILRTGMVPHWQFDASREISYDDSGLAGDGTRSPHKSLRWFGSNTDGMHIRAVAIRDATPSNNILRLRQDFPAAADFSKDIAAGFAKAYKLFLRNQERLLDKAGPLVAFQKMRVRYVLRATQVYDSLIHNSYAPANLRRGIDRSLSFEPLAGALARFPHRPSAFAVLDDELASVERSDIPVFFTTADGTHLCGDSSVVRDFFVESAYDSTVKKICTLNEEDLAFQLSLLESSFAAARISAMNTAAGEKPAWKTTLSKEALISEAENIGLHLLDRSYAGEDGSITWLGTGYVPQAQKVQFRPVGDNMYDGRSGVALFFAALFLVTGHERWRSATYACFKTLRIGLRNLDSNLVEDRASFMDIGAAVGIGSVVYALATAAQLLGEDAFYDDAKVLAALVTPRIISSDLALDVVSGSAGAILGLLKLASATGDESILERAVLCGKRLAEAGIEDSEGNVSWKTVGAVPLTGFSHGSAGFALALAKLGDAVQDRHWTDVALRAVAHENRHYSAEHSNWRDLRPWSADYAFAWCHGASGIGLSRLGIHRLCGDERCLADARAAAQIVSRQLAAATDGLCCGTSGYIDFLAECATPLEDPAMHSRAEELAATLLGNKRDGKYALYPGFPESFSPGLFQGLSGIGYTMLRLCRKLPCLLLWD